MLPIGATPYVILKAANGANNLWRISMPLRQTPWHSIPAFHTDQVLLLLQLIQQPEADHVQFVHAVLGSSPPTTFLRAVARGYITYYSNSETSHYRKCLHQIELTMNVLHPFEYDPRISAYHGLFGPFRLRL
jgi:hypothetical protein